MDAASIGGPGPGADVDALVPPTDLQKWLTLAIALTATLIVVLDNTVLNVAIPTILHEFHTTLPSLEWVITGYALTFATFLIIGGRLGDIYGHRRVFVVGAALFGLGSLLASASWNVASLVVGEALIEGLGASLMLPATLAVLSTTFEGRQRATAFAAWGAVAGSAAGLGPVLGGYLTSEFSWRWSFRINVIIAPLAIVGALLFIARTERSERREPLDVPGAALIAVGMFLFVFGLSEGGSYGWITPIRRFTVLGHEVWSGSAPISVIPLVFGAAACALVSFYRVERARERDQRSPLFEFGLFQHRTFRYGMITTVVVAMGQLGLSFALALFLQEGRHLDALHNGLWVLPFGLSILAGSPFGARLTNRIGATMVVRIGLMIQACGLIYIALSIAPDLTFLRLLPGLVCYGLGAGWASTQLTSVILSDIPRAKSGVASGTNTTVRQVGGALGIAVVGTLVTTQSIHHAVAGIRRSTVLPASVKGPALAQVRAVGSGFRPGAHLPTAIAAELDRVVGQSVSSGARDALLFASAVVLIGTGLSWLIPKVAISAAPTTTATEVAEELADLVPIDADTELAGFPAGAAAGRPADRAVDPG